MQLQDFIRTLKVTELVVLRHEAIALKDEVTKKAIDDELKKRGAA